MESAAQPCRLGPGPESATAARAPSGLTCRLGARLAAAPLLLSTLPLATCLSPTPSPQRLRLFPASLSSPQPGSMFLIIPLS